MTEINRWTKNTLLVLKALVEVAPEPLHGTVLPELTGAKLGSVYGGLKRLEDHGWVKSYWESDEEAEAAGRPRRRYYRLEPEAVLEARALFEERAPRFGIWWAHRWLVWLGSSWLS